MTALPDLLRSTRTRLGLSLSQMGERLGVDRQTVHRWEVGTRTPSQEKLLRETLERMADSDEPPIPGSPAPYPHRPVGPTSAHP